LLAVALRTLPIVRTSFSCCPTTARIAPGSSLAIGSRETKKTKARSRKIRWASQRDFVVLTTADLKNPTGLTGRSFGFSLWSDQENVGNHKGADRRSIFLSCGSSLRAESEDNVIHSSKHLIDF